MIVDKPNINSIILFDDRFCSSIEHDMKYFVLCDFHTESTCNSSQSCVAALVFGVFVRSLFVVNTGKFSVRPFIIVESEVRITTAEPRSKISSAVNQICICYGNHLFVKIQLDQKCSSLFIADLALLFVPFVVRKPTNSFSCLSTY